MTRLTFTDYTSTSPRRIDSIPTFSFSANNNINIGHLNHSKNLPRAMENRRIVFGVACLMRFHNKISINSITKRKSSNRDTVSIQNIFMRRPYHMVHMEKNKFLELKLILSRFQHPNHTNFESELFRPPMAILISLRVIA